MKTLYIITGANGHLGSVILRYLHKHTNSTLRGLILPHEEGNLDDVTYVKGDVTDISSLYPLFQDIEHYHTFVIHTAGIVDIQDHVSPQLYNVNVQGTKNILKLVKQFPVERFLYVSSVHAIPEKHNSKIITETTQFDPNKVLGGYAKTKAEATLAVLHAQKENIPVIIVHPSGIIGPYGTNENHLIQMFNDCIDHKLPACIKGGYDFVDVRDVAIGCLLALHKGNIGECYILSNKYYTIEELFSYIYHYTDVKKLPTLPMNIAKILIPGMMWYAKLRQQRPLFTTYSLYTLQSDANFSHQKATLDLNYHPRDMEETMRDTIQWYRKRTA